MAVRNEPQNWKDRNRGTTRPDFDERGYGNNQGYRGTDNGRNDFGMRDDNRAGGDREPYDHASENDRGDVRRYDEERSYDRDFGTWGGGMGGRRNYGSGAGAYNRSDDLNDSYGGRQNRESDRGFMDKASDEVSSWFGDSAAQNRREADHRGRGPKGYQRSDSRIEEDINDRLTDDQDIDPSDVQIKVESGEVTLEGTVDSKRAKRHAEDCCDSVSGVKHVQNNLRVKDNSTGTTSTAL